MPAVEVVRPLRRAVGSRLPAPVRRRLRYRRTFGRHLPLGRPETFMGKVNWRILRDRRPLLLGSCDKLAMKQHVALTAGDLVRVPWTLWAGTDLTELADVDLPAHWVLKPNHGSQRVLFGHGLADPEALARTTAGWLQDDRRHSNGEWAYGEARAVLLVEELVGAPGQPPPDLKVYVFNGVPRMVQVHHDRFGAHSSRVYRPDWTPLHWDTGHAVGPEMPAPARASQLLAAASALARGFDFLRVDFYLDDDVLWFSELTPYPGSGLVRIGEDMDRTLGAWWRLPASRRSGERVLPDGPRTPTGLPGWWLDPAGAQPSPRT